MGELIQIDGSHHDWFEGRSPHCCLLVFIDDATGKLMRLLHDLSIELICANSSQAKGRVERANKTLQDRLVKEMRLQCIDNIEQANVWLPDFIADFNLRFAKPAKYPKDMYRSVRC